MDNIENVNDCINIPPSQTLNHCPEDGGSRFLLRVGNSQIPTYNKSHPKDGARDSVVG
jgi:hypothetical protein